ncbi:MAG: alpha/beta hydrolase family protein [Acidobacteriota bacterium]
MSKAAALLLSLLLGTVWAAEGPLEQMHAGMRDYLLRLPVKDGRPQVHPLLLEADRCPAAKPKEVVVWLSYRKLDCAAWPGVEVIAPRLIHPDRRERVRRMGFPFALIPLGFELAHWEEAKRKHRVPVRLEPPAGELFGPVETPRPQENAFGISIRPHDERQLERSTEDISKIESHLLGLIPTAETRRSGLMKKTGVRELARRWHSEVVGELPRYEGPFQAHERTVMDTVNWIGISVTIDALPGVIAQGVLLKPKDLRPGERRPLVILQHGLMGSPESLFRQPVSAPEYRTYRNFAERLVAERFIVFCPQNPYSGDFRPLQMLANPRGLSLFSFIEAQYRRTLDYLEKQPFVDSRKIVYYGLSYGGATALRVPVFDKRFRGIVCGGNFNEWIRKLISPELPYSYVHTREYEIYEWNQANVASHAELAAMAALLHERPIPFLVERGHRDRVGTDEWVNYEFERLKKYVSDPELRRLAFFDGEHRTDGEAAIPFLKEVIAGN